MLHRQSRTYIEGAQASPLACPTVVAACPNQDVVYGLGFFSLDEEPVVIQVPDFGDRYDRTSISRVTTCRALRAKAYRFGLRPIPRAVHSHFGTSVRTKWRICSISETGSGSTQIECLCSGGRNLQVTMWSMKARNGW